MKVIAAVLADFERALLGGPSRLGERLGSRPILHHALRRAAQVAGVEQRVLCVSPRDAQAAAAALRESGVEGRIRLLEIDAGHRPRLELIRCARKWNLHAWRGAPLGMTYFDEFVEPIVAARVLISCEADAALCIDAHSPAFDAAIAGQMVRHLRESGGDAAFVVTRAPPGLAGIVLTREVVQALVQAGAPVGVLLSYRPETPRADPIARAECVRVPADIYETRARLTGDTLRSRELLAAAFEHAGEDCTALELCRTLRRLDCATDPLPPEVEIELTTDDPLPETTLRPRGGRAGSRRLVDFDALGRLAAELAGYDDRLVVLAGHGDPLLHPRFAEACGRLRAAGVCGLAVATPLVELPEAACEALFEHRVDVVEVQLDADSAETYRRVNRRDGFEQVVANVERLRSLRRERASPAPIVVPSMTRCEATMAEVETFFDRWTAAVGSAVLHGHNDYSGRIAPDSLIPFTPAVRGPCRRLGRRLTLLADGKVAQCGQDVAGASALGDWTREPLRAIWAGEGLRRLRGIHEERAWGGQELCRSCRQWFRP